MKQTFDPGLTQQFGGRLRRSINKDGSFNVRRHGVGVRNANIYLNLIDMSWPRFISVLLSSFIAINLLFATLYHLAGVEHLLGARANSAFESFMNVVFFSVHTLTTVGYGNIVPSGLWTNTIAAFEAMTGLLGFAIATGLLYGRFSRPSARIRYSEQMVIAPYRGITSLQFRIVNQRSNVLMEMEAKMMLMTVEEVDGERKRKYQPLNLERTTVEFFPLTWTIVHPIESDSPIYGKSAQDLADLDTEILILVKGFDDTFSQVVHSRYSYRYNEIVFGAKFVQAFEITPDGDLRLDVDRVGEIVSA